MKNEIMKMAQKIKAELTRYPEGYDIDTAMAGVALIFSENKLFPQCTPESKYRAVLDMAVQGLDPLAGHCSFVPQKNKDKIELQLRRDYSGSILVAKRQDKRIADIRAEVIREGESFRVDIINGLKRPRHEGRTFDTWNARIIGTYAVAVDAEDKIIDMDLMSAEDVKRTWKNSHLTYKGVPVVLADGRINPNSNHGKYPERMIRKTVLHRLCRQIIKSSNDTVLVSAVDRSDEEGEPSYQVELEHKPEHHPQQPPQQSQPKSEPPPRPVTEPAPESPADDHKISSETAKKIVQISDLSANIVESISEFVGRPVGSMLDLTESEGQAYINSIGSKGNNGNVADKPKDPSWL